MKTYTKLPLRALWIWTLAALFMFYKYILQNFPSVMTQELMSSFHVESLGLGILSSAYFWTYLIVPLFAGILLDTFGVRWISSLAILLAAMGLYVFLATTTINHAIWGRVLMGIGASFATLSYFKIASLWFSARAYSILTALLVSIGMLGAIVGQAPLAWFSHHYGWQKSLEVLSYLGCLLGVIFLISVKDRQNTLGMDDSTYNLKQDIICRSVNTKRFCRILITKRFCRTYHLPREIDGSF